MSATSDLPAHARLSPSAQRWLHCPGAPNAEAGKPEIRSAIAVAGTAVHGALELALRLGARHIDWLTEPTQQYAAQLALDVVYGALHRHPQAQLLIETRLGPPNWRPQNDLYGTADVIILDPQLLLIGDLKYGLHSVAADSPQLQIYLALAVERFGMRPKLFTLVLQPRLSRPLRIASWRPSEVMAFTERLRLAATATDQPNAPRVANPYCYFCRAKATCPALQLRQAADATNDLDAALAMQQVA
jgi:hypothetical protein